MNNKDFVCADKISLYVTPEGVTNTLEGMVTDACGQYVAGNYSWD